MRIGIMAIVMMVLGALQINAQSDQVVGIWLTQEADSKIEISKDANGVYSGKIIWLKTPKLNGKPRFDTNNPDEALKIRPIIGLNLLNNFTFDDDEWVDGTIYDPKSGKTYSSLMWFDDEDDTKTLSVKGYVGVSIMGRTVTWTKVQ